MRGAVFLALAVQAAASGVADIYPAAYEAARAAFRDGGAEPAVAPVRVAIDRLATAHPAGQAQIARYVLQAAIAAAQSEHDELRLYIEHAVTLEAAELSLGRPPAPVISAHEAAGELWLQVYRDDDAERAFTRARQVVGDTPRIQAGLARITERRTR